MNGKLWYVYAVLRARSASHVAWRIAGVRGSPVRALAHGGLAAVASPVEAGDFEEASLRANLEDLGWLERVARDHHRVVGHLLPTGCVLPLRLATVCRQTAGVRRMLSEHREDFEAVIERVDGRAEWGVKVYADPPAGRPARPSQAPADRPESGREYLRRRRQRRQETGIADRRVEAAVVAIHAALAEAADGSRLHPPQEARLSGEPGQNALNGAYLVRRDREVAFAALAGRLGSAATGLRLVLSGPWAPYSFTAAANGEPTPRPAPQRDHDPSPDLGQTAAAGSR